MNGRLKAIADALLLKEQNGFRKGRSHIDSNIVLKLIIENRREFNLELPLALVDIKSFDNVKLFRFCSITERRGSLYK